MTPEARLAAVVVSYNGGDALLDCLRSLRAQTVPDLEVIVVDPVSTDGSVERAESAFGADIRVIHRATNGGYAANANTGWRATDAPLVAILNHDLTLAPDCLEQMRRVLLDDPREALVNPKLVLKSDPTRVNAIGNDVHLSGVAWCHGLGSLADDWHGVVEVTAISGAAVMARRDLLERLCGWEERYFLYQDDVDLSARARLAGAVCLVACDAVATHDWSLALTPKKFSHLERSRRGWWKRFVGPSNGRWLVYVQAEAMGWAYAALHGRSYLRAKWGAQKDPLDLGPLDERYRILLPSLSRRHPYEVLFPKSRRVVAVGRLVDALVSRWLSIASAIPSYRSRSHDRPKRKGSL